MGRAVWGIDVSKFSVKAVRLEGEGDRLRLTAVDVVDIEAPGGAEGPEMDEAVRKAVRTLKSRTGMAGEVLCWSLPSHSVFNRLIKLPPVDPEKIGEIVRYEAQQQIPYPLEEVIWDFQRVDREYAPGEETEVILFAIKREVVNQFIANVQAAGLDADQIQFSPVALYNYMMYDQEMSQAAVILDMGADNTDLIIIDGSKFWIRNLPITGNDLTKAVAKAFNVPFHQAEKLKIEAAKSPQGAKIFGAIQPVLKDLVGEIHRSLGFYKTISRQIRFDRVILMGSATRTVNFQKFLSQSLQLAAVRMETLSKIAIDPRCDRGRLESYLGTLGAALGLAIQGAGLSANRVNLVPPEIRAAKAFRKKRPFFAAGVAALAAAVVMMHLKAAGETSAIRAKIAELNGVKTKLDGLGKTYEQVRDDSAYRQPLEALRRLLPDRDLPLRVVDAIHKRLPDNGQGPDNRKIWILRLELADDGAAGGEAAATPPGGKPPYPSDWQLTVALTAGITHRDVAGARKFLVDQLGAPIAKEFKLGDEGKDWDISLDAQVEELDPNVPASARGEFDRLKVIWRIKRIVPKKPAPAAGDPASGETPPKGGG